MVFREQAIRLRKPAEERLTIRQVAGRCESLELAQVVQNSVNRTGGHVSLLARVDISLLV
jgi:hypothetical protein